MDVSIQNFSLMMLQVVLTSSVKCFIVHISEETAVGGKVAKTGFSVPLR